MNDDVTIVLTVPQLVEFTITDTNEHELNVQVEIGIVKYYEIDTDV